ncbi:hypothetical protein [Acetobacter tropicalis]|uniref:hypothetical protein n=1 Tax=Acetobacter tropicalis TaxID=104102 RepID=UPI00165718D5|nr:hypothetical protein [Acetobacter tropicalis]MBC9010106.1 hypothetical protein [Acetobacter tropicalis]MDO8170958.1 hypothetical protein [Acetobacter tropicalis]
MITIQTGAKALTLEILGGMIDFKINNNIAASFLTVLTFLFYFGCFWEFGFEPRDITAEQRHQIGTARHLRCLEHTQLANAIQKIKSTVQMADCHNRAIFFLLRRFRRATAAFFVFATINDLKMPIGRVNGGPDIR